MSTFSESARSSEDKNFNFFFNFANNSLMVVYSQPTLLHFFSFSIKETDLRKK